MIKKPTKGKKFIAVDLTSDNRLPDVIIKSSTAEEVALPITEKVHISKNLPVSSIGGRTDLISTIKSIPGVSVGSEAQNGFTVRGGGPDQNLVLLDGIPVYETSHLGGLSSIFSDNTIKSASLHKTGIPASFGSKLSSVLDIRLKDGNRTEYKREVMLNLENFSGFIEGPISENTSIIFNGRVSLINLYSEPILRQFFDIEDSELSYFDVYTKVSHWFAPTNRLSFTFYTGDDNIRLLRQNTDSELSFIDSNDLGWNNTLATLNWSRVLGDKVYFHSQIGYTEFQLNSRSSNRVDAESTSSLTVNIESLLRDYIGKADIEIFTDNYGKIRAGGGWTLHNNSPSILEAQEFQSTETNSDSMYVSNEFFLFSDYEVDIVKGLSAKAGIRTNIFSGLDTTYILVEPRIEIEAKNKNSHFKIGYSRLSQFLHLLLNPSSGLPSDLWVPSTKTVAPETSNLISAEYGSKTSFGSQYTIGAFYNTYQGLIEYNNPFEITQAIVTNHMTFNSNVSPVNWEQLVTIGSGRSFGLELSWHQEWRNFSADISYTLSQSTRTFIFNNEQITFPSRFDRPHNISTHFNYKIDDTKRINVTWVFGNGNTWTFTDETRPGLDGNPILDPRGIRNNRRLSSYHRLGVSYHVDNNLSNNRLLEYSIGIYNLYNNRNPFFAFLRQNPETAASPVSEIETSLYPIFPQFNVRYVW